MSVSFKQRSWFRFGWLRGWSWIERIIVAVLWLLPIVPLLYGWRTWRWLAGLFALSSVVALNVVVYRHGGWQLLGPHFYYDVVRLARRGRSTILRVVYIIAMFVGLFFVYESMHVTTAMSQNDLARVSDRFAYTLFMVQNLAIAVLAPAYLGSAIAEEKERHTLELLFTTHLSDTEIILGKLTSRIIHLFGFVLAGFPILCLVQFWGGIDMLLIAGNILNTMLNVFSIGSICLLLSVLCRSVAAAVMASYVAILPTTFCCVAALQGFPFVLQDARQAGDRVISVQDLGLLAIAHLIVTGMCLVFAVIALRETEVLGLGPLPPPPNPPEPKEAPPEITAMLHEVTTVRYARVRLEEDPHDAFASPYTLPPMNDNNPLLWKERFVGGPQWAFSPIVLMPSIPFVATAFLVTVLWFMGARFTDVDEHQRALHAGSIVLRFFYYVFLGCYLLGVAYNAAGSVVRERQQQTLEALLLLPIERREILKAKWLASLIRGWPWLALLAGDILLGFVANVYHPISAALLLIVPIPIILLLASAGLLISVTMRTALRANLVLVVILLAVFYCSAGKLFADGTFAYLEPFFFSELDQHTFQDDRHFSIANGLMMAYLLTAAGCWKLALLIFENRSRQME
jgi:ABC-type transport system involved in multi-copper enzyme maturation permease subunit